MVFMLKVVVFSVVMFCSNFVFSQIISGEIYNVGRRLISETNFTLKGSKIGEVVFDVSVDIYGKITSAVVVKSLTNVTSTPMLMDAKNLVNSYKFEPGNGYPKFHHGLIKISFIDK